MSVNVSRLIRHAYLSIHLSKYLSIHLSICPSGEKARERERERESFIYFSSSITGFDHGLICQKEKERERGGGGG